MKFSAPTFMSDSRDINKDYLFLTVIGSGSFGKVHKVQSRANNQIFACKEMDYAKMAEKERKLLVHECNTLKELHHPQIVAYVDRYLDKAHSKIYIVMEYCENGDLARYIKRHKQERSFVAEDKIWSVLVQLLNALKYCHHDLPIEAGHKVIHRDLKPGNVFLTRDGSVKLGDFGLCRSANEQSQVTTNVGTPLYMPPEILAKQAYTEKADVWSLGCVIYELAALQPPFQATNMDSLKIKVKSGARPSLPSTYSQSLRQIIDLMLENSQSKRQSIVDLIQFKKVQQMQNMMVEKGMPGAPTNVDTVGQMTPPAGKEAIREVPTQQKDRETLEQKVEELKQQFAPPKPLGEMELKQWEERLREKEMRLAAWEAELKRK